MGSGRPQRTPGVEPSPTRPLLCVTASSRLAASREALTCRRDAPTGQEPARQPQRKSHMGPAGKDSAGAGTGAGRGPTGLGVTPERPTPDWGAFQREGRRESSSEKGEDGKEPRFSARTAVSRPSGRRGLGQASRAKQRSGRKAGAASHWTSGAGRRWMWEDGAVTPNSGPAPCTVSAQSADPTHVPALPTTSQELPLRKPLEGLSTEGAVTVGRRRQPRVGMRSGGGESGPSGSPGGAPQGLPGWEVQR